MKFEAPLIAVKDLEISKRFYHDVLGQDVIIDFGANITLTGGFSMQTLDTWTDFLHKDKNQIIFGSNSYELYFEEDDFDTFIKKLNGFKDIEYVHRTVEHTWGQRAVRFYDPDKHIIEVGENIVSVVQRFIKSGLSEKETAVRMDVSLDYIKSCLE